MHTVVISVDTVGLDTPLFMCYLAKHKRCQEIYGVVGLVRKRLEIIVSSHASPLPIVDTLFKRFAFDLFGPYPRTSRGHSTFLVQFVISPDIQRIYL